MLRRLTTLVAITLATVSCGSDGADATDRDAGVYVAVIRALALGEAGEGTPGGTIDELDRVVYVGPLDDEQAIPLEVQAAVVEQLDELATVRFVDERAEAIDDDDEDAPVLEDGVLVLVGPVPAGGGPSVDAERYVDAGDTARLRVRLEPTDGAWKVVGVDTIGA